MVGDGGLMTLFSGAGVGPRAYLIDDRNGLKEVFR